MGKEILFELSKHKRINSDQNTFAYVYFPEVPNHKQLRAHGIDLTPNKMLYKNVYKLFIDSFQFAYLESLNALINSVQPTNKIINPMQIKTASRLIAHGLNDNIQFIEEKLFKIITKSAEFIIIETIQHEESAENLSYLNEIEFISKYTPPNAANNIGSGFMQKNSKTFL